MVAMSGSFVIVEFRETDRQGVLELSKVFRQVNRPRRNYDYNMYALLSWIGSDHIFEVILASSQVSPPTTTIYQGSFLPRHKCDSHSFPATPLPWPIADTKLNYPAALVKH